VYSSILNITTMLMLLLYIFKICSSFPLIRFSICHCVNISNSLWYRNFDFVGTIWYFAALVSSRTSSGILHHPFPQRVHNHFIDITELSLFCRYFIFFHRTDSPKHVIYLFYFKFGIQSYRLKGSFTKLR
jgi:hypothetical protein